MNDASVKSSVPLADRGPVNIVAGRIAGEVAPECDKVSRFLGVPYAAPPLGALRWRPAEPATPWDGIREAHSFSPAPMQPIDPTLAMFGVQKGESTSEDCLYLNVWTPASEPSDQLPVMVWIHGGGFRTGHGAHPMYNGVRLAEKGVVVVTINYRLNVFGGLAHPLLTAESGHHASGNYALMDQISALEWVRDNITAFGGDPGNVTVFGESAGGRSISLLMLSPLAKDLFHRGICQSGALRDTGGSLANREAQGLTVAKALGVDAAETPLDALRSADWQVLSEATGFNSNPFVDGWVVPDHPEALYAAGEIHDKPLLIGTNANEAGLFATQLREPVDTAAKFKAIIENEFGNAAESILAAYPAATDDRAQSAWNDLRTDMWFTLPARHQARWLDGASRTSYLYCLSRIPPWRGGRAMGAHHGAEIPYVFGGGIRCGAFAAEGADDPTDRALSETMMSYWVNFATTGDPNGDGLPDWNPYRAAEESYMSFSDDTRAAQHLYGDRLDALEAALEHHSGISNIYGE